MVGLFTPCCTSIYNRQFDDQTQPKIFLETQAAILILQMVQARRDLSLKVINPADLILEIEER
ncbi:MAG: hypothetical protein PT120_13235 [Aphanizomenon gracile PMC649.10]|uniref:hypothetical protein n=1 Tax=Dolichospermum sp. LEGE 00240 TaxID=1828603 RepID=UPI001D13DC74|nr:hypothetical protein [Dolichospermum sp. LEGE 00240]MDM3851038.1 hypothetical protein [Aphanizomenon gracile PMC627.10]MDM3855827.1 hypothetical protein [Aphanizomenon gracile PMC649.10]MDM3859668.1 hypothetical protein [Aphanizomenon gracile PMC644.10]